MRAVAQAVSARYMTVSRALSRNEVYCARSGVLDCET